MMTLKRLLRRCLFAAMLSALSSSALAEASNPPVVSLSNPPVVSSSNPNIVILYADDMGVGDVSYRDPEAKIQTPNIDRLASQGMTFTDGHSSSGICTPSRYALLTGQHHWRRFHNIVGAFGKSVFKPGEFTVARMLKEQGYTTACFGKWHLGWDWNAIRKPGVSGKERTLASSYDWTKRFPGGPLGQGFDHYFGDGTINFPPYCWIEDDRFLTIPSKPVIKSKPLAGGGGFRAGPMAEGWDPYEILPTITEKTVEWIEQQTADKPFFAYLAFNSPHYPIVPNKEFHGTSEAGYYGDFVIETDAMVGKVLAALEENGLSENTIVIFTADNGSEKHAFERLDKFDQWSSGKFRGLKRDLYEGGHRVPFIVSWPGTVKAGARSNEVVSQVDLVATLAEITGYDLSNEEAIDSYNILPVLAGDAYTSPLRQATVQNTNPDQYSLRQGDWVLINSHTGSAQKEPDAYLKHFTLQTYPKNTPGLLFNLKDDPRQSKNLYNANPERVKAMSALLERYVAGERCAPERPKAN
ncbi:MAG: sulfatase family protein [Opitutaceae bacterium]